MYHSLTFYDGTKKKNTYDDWHLVPETRPIVVPPEPKYKYLEIPGANGVIDLTESLTGTPIFNNREGEWTFYVLNGFGEWADRLSTMMSFMQGCRLRVVLDDDPGFCYEGRFHITDWDSSGDTYSIVTIAYNVEPYKKGCTEQSNTSGGVTQYYLSLTGVTRL